MATVWQARQMCAWSPQPLRQPPGGRAEPLATGAARGGGCVADLACQALPQSLASSGLSGVQEDMPGRQDDKPLVHRRYPAQSRFDLVTVA